MKYINELYTFLNEKLLLKEFKIGFELEAVIRENTFDAEILKRFKKIDSFWGKGHFTPENLDCPDTHTGFEYNSPPFNFTNSNIKKLIKFLSSLEDLNIYVTPTSALHIHINYTNMTSEDSFWALCNLAMDEGMLKKVNRFKGVSFIDSTYAQTDFIQHIRYIIKDASANGVEKLKELNDIAYGIDKYRTFRIHPIGTIEWRGPRNFINDKILIKDFVFLLKDLLSWLSKVMSYSNIFTTAIKRDQFRQYVSKDPLFKKNVIKVEKRQSLIDFKKRISDLKRKGLTLKSINYRNNDVTVTGEWKNGEWDSGIFTNGTWHNGSWETGEFRNGKWLNGEWGNGEFRNSIWTNGVWKKGGFINSEWLDGLWLAGTWVSGTWHNGEWKKGVWKNGKWEDGIWQTGTWHDGIWKEGVWKNGKWEDGTWDDGKWEDGIWRDGMWTNGVWEKGTWLYGQWERGSWLGGLWTEGEIYSPIYNDHVYSEIPPNEFYIIEKEVNSIEELEERALVTKL